MVQHTMTASSLLLYSALLSLLLVPIIIAGVAGFFLLRWEKIGRWQEAKRHEFRIRMKIARWIWFRYIHLDCQYWIAFVNFDKGPLKLVGQPPDALYWSFTYNKFMEVGPVINSNDVRIGRNGEYEILISTDRPEDAEANWLNLRKGVGRGVIYFRIYEPRGNFPTRLPSVFQNGKQVVVEGCS